MVSEYAEVYPLQWPSVGVVAQKEVEVNTCPLSCEDARLMPLMMYSGSFCEPQALSPKPSFHARSPKSSPLVPSTRRITPSTGTCLPGTGSPVVKSTKAPAPSSAAP